MRMHRARFLAAAAALTSIAGYPSVARAQTDDKSFVYGMLQEAKGQIRFAQLAQERALSQTVRGLGSRVERDWTAMQAALGQIAFSNAYPTPGALNADELATLDRLGRTQPDDFDQAYFNLVQAAYDSAMSRMTAERSTSDGALQSFIARTLPIFTDTRRAADKRVF